MEPEDHKTDAGEPKTEVARPSIDEKKLTQVSRRELLKLTPLLVLGAFAIRGFQVSLLK